MLAAWPCLRSRFRFHRAAAPSGVCSSNRPFSPTSGFPSAGSRLLLGLLLGAPPAAVLDPRGGVWTPPARGRVDRRRARRRRLHSGPWGPVTCSELSKSVAGGTEAPHRADKKDTIRTPQTVQPHGSPHSEAIEKACGPRALGRRMGMTTLPRLEPQKPGVKRAVVCGPQGSPGPLGDLGQSPLRPLRCVAAARSAASKKVTVMSLTLRQIRRVKDGGSDPSLLWTAPRPSEAPTVRPDRRPIPGVPRRS